VPVDARAFIAVAVDTAVARVAFVAAHAMGFCMVHDGGLANAIERLDARGFMVIMV
jgi:hypothetical protein